MKKKPTKIEKQHMALVASIPCCVCGAMPVNVHHIRTGQGIGMKASSFETIPLCYNHHQGKEGIHAIGTKTWQKKYGSELDFLNETQQRIAGLKLSRIIGG